MLGRLFPAPAAASWRRCIGPDRVHRRSYTPKTRRACHNGKMFIALTLNGADERDMFFDTGSSAMAPLILHQVRTAAAQ